MSVVSGELRQWQRVTIDFEGPQLSETSKTFTDYRLDVEFRNVQTGQTITVPGFFAADGNAANTGATSGNVWRVHFNPPEVGQWVYEASFRTGANVAASMDPAAGTALSFNGETGTINVASAATSGSDFRTDGMLVQDGHYYVHKGTGEIWIKGGSDSPENFLGYVEFDGTRDQAGGTLKTWSAHQQDFNAGDPTWMQGRGSEIIGAINYLAEQGVNSQYIMLMTANGDGKDVWPWTDPAARTTYDVSKLAQWEIVFEHMDDMGVAQHLVLQETENDQLLGGMSIERAIYYREMVARFGHHNGVTWNMGEENTNTDAERKAFMDRFKDLDPYDHPVVVHTYEGDLSKVYDPLLGYQPMDGMSLQAPDPRAALIKYQQASENAGDPWLINWDEDGPADTGALPDSYPGADANHDMLRAKMWGAFTAGASGVEWYSGYKAEGDIVNQNYRVREDVWNWTEIGRKFFESLPLQQMHMNDSLTTNTGDFVTAKEGEIYAIYLPKGGTTSLNLSGQSGTFDVTWFNPRTGAYTEGAVTTVSGGAIVNLGTPPNTAAEDWAILVKKMSDTNPPPVEPPPPTEEPPPPSTEPIARYYIMDADSHETVIELVEGSVLDPMLLQDRNLTIVATANAAHPAAGSIESVRLSLDGGHATRIENVEPYALFGDQNGDLNGTLQLQGQHGFQAEFYNADGANGTLLGTASIAFSVALAPSLPRPSEPLAQYYLMDTDSQDTLIELVQGVTVDSALIDGRNVTIMATANAAYAAAASIESVKLTFDSGAVTQLENVTPYALFGDSNGDLRGSLELGGQHQLAAAFYDSDWGNGSLVGTESLSFLVV